MYLKRIVLAVLLLGLLGAGAFAFMVYTTLLTPNTAFANKEAHVFIPTDADFQDVMERVTPLLKNESSFRRAADQKKYSGNIKAGKYVLRKGMSNNEIINVLRSANTPLRLSFNNQETLEDLAGRISKQIEADSLSLLDAFRDDEFLNAEGFTEESALGLYIPNSYEFFWNTGAAAFRERMLKEYKRFWNQDRLAKAEKLGLTPAQVISLAAIVQKETVKVDERPRVAGVYLNRINRGMLLQADPTVIYAIKKMTGNFDTVIRRVLYRDLELDSPYNTYKYPGIPPGPITMPDISSIDAVLNAEKHNYLYFVADIENFGYHVFARTLAQHNRNKVQYIRWVNKQKIRR